MALYQSEAFVLRTYKLGEADQIIVLFTRDYGKLRVVARQSHSPRRYTAGYYQPLMLLRAIVYGRPTQALYRTHTVDIIESFRALRDDFDLLRCGLYMTELIDVTTHEREPAPELFALLHEALQQLLHMPAPDMLLRLFELRLLTIIGYTPQLLSCARCDAVLPPHAHTFSAQFGGLLCTSCVGEVRQTLTVSPATLAYLRRIVLEEDDDAVPAPLLDAGAQQELERLLHLHLTSCLGRELKSYAFLHL